MDTPESTLRDLLATDGYALAPQVVSRETIERVVAAIDQSGHDATEIRSSRNARGVIESHPSVAELAGSDSLRNLAASVLGEDPFVVRGLYFDKIPAANWRVGWHQDQIVPVAQRIETPGFTAWSEKQGVAHVRPPSEVLERMVILRIHLDRCDLDNGPLEVLPGSHRHGLLSPPDIAELAARSPVVTCTAEAGDVLVMRPLLLHASQPADAPAHRRVLHLDFARDDLPGELEWYRPLGEG